ncbi:MAG: methionyl-tRNA formyltransferase [Alphaproteobacteria bacterium]|nr:methionyl-tRNA formyltransferase [Alphaproteobacteria bacterium]
MAQSIVFMGTPDFAVPAFEALRAATNDAYNIVAVYTRPPAKQGRGLQLTKSPVHQAAEAAGIQVFTPTRLKDKDELERFHALQPDLAVVVAYGMILPQDWLDTPTQGCWNIHASLLPRWRGAAPIQRALMAGDAETGVAIMQMAAGLDTGPVLLEKRIAIAADDTAQSLHDKLALLGGAAIGEALMADDLVPHEQPQDGVTYAEKIDKAEAKIDFSRSATTLDAHIRGLSPFPGAWFEANGKRVKVLAAKPIAANGTMATVAESGAIYCGEGALQLVTVQPAGKGAMTGADFLRGRGLVPAQKLDT